MFFTRFKTIVRFQQKDKSLIEIAKVKPKDYSIKQFHRAGKTYSLACKHGKIVIPKHIKKSCRMVPYRTMPSR